MKARVPAFAALFFCVVLALACGQEAPPEEGGFPNETRVTFFDGDPYEEISQVEWHEWTEDALEKAKDKPILLDLSGLWCHACHVYDIAVYANEATAAFINENFHPVRVDPDARPDVDARYNRGGWPTLVVLTPEGDIVGGTTYDPERARAFLESTLAVYQSGGDSLRSMAVDQREQLVKAQPLIRERGELDPDVLRKVLSGVKSFWDVDYGGLASPNSAGKLTSPRVMQHLLEEAIRNPALDPDLPGFVRTTLDNLAAGAVHDHLFGGFFRSVEDRAWSRPHFEKLLNAQAWTAELYLTASPLWATGRYEEIARETIEFVFDELSNPDGITFSNALDSDTGPGDDSTFYTWTVAEVDSLLSPEEATIVKYHYGIAPAGELLTRTDANTLYESYDVEEAAKRLGQEPAVFAATLDRAETRMRAARLAGPRPRVDATAYAAANLDMAVTLLLAHDVIGDPKYLARARSVIDFFTETHFDAESGIPHGFDGKKTVGPAMLRDQVAGLRALVRAHEATGEAEYLARAEELATFIRAKYHNPNNGSYWDLPAETSGFGLLSVKIRPVDENVRLADLYMDLFVTTGKNEYRQQAERVLASFVQSFANAGLNAVDYAVAVNRLAWRLRGESS